MKNSLKKVRPDLAKEWDREKNFPLTPDDVSYGSSKVVHWKCSIGHQWSAKVNARSSGQSCPYCSRRRVSDLNRLSINYPDITKDWDVKKNGDLKPDQVSYGSKRKVWWKCTNNHSWQATIYSRTKSKSKCPHCPRSYLPKVDINNSLKKTFPILAEQWHPTKNAPIKPENINRSSNKKFWWKCNRGHSWQATVNNRTNKLSGCPKCSGGTSRGEMRIAAELSTIFKLESRHKIENQELDIFIPSINIGIEYDGAYWHKEKEIKDGLKNKFFEKRKIKIFRIRERPLKQINHDDLIVGQKSLSKKTINKLLVLISEFCNKNQRRKIKKYIEKKKFVANNKFLELLSFYPSPPKNKSLKFVNPALAREWDFVKNKPLKPIQISYGSEIEFWWKCSKGHEWKKSPKHRNRSPECPKCFSLRNRLDIVNPDLALRWHPTKNDNLSPKDFSAGSSEIVWWKCSDENECQGTIASRNAGHNCKVCPHTDRTKRNKKWQLSKITEAMNFWDMQKNKELDISQLTYGSNMIVWWRCDKGHSWEQSIKSFEKKRSCPECSNARGSKSRSLKKVRPDLAKEWDREKNFPLTPDDVSYGSSKVVHWKCSIGHQWSAKVNARSSGQSCPYCSRRRVSTLNSLEKNNLELFKMLHPTKNNKVNLSKITLSSNKKLWWVCSRGHEWKQSPNTMTSKKRKNLCRKCYLENNSISIKRPDLLNEWDYVRNLSIKPNDITCGTDKKVWWLCANGHSWEASVNNRAKGSGCPKCAIIRRSK